MFPSAAAAERFYTHYERMPPELVGEIAPLLTMLTQTDGTIYGEPAEVARSPSMTSYHPLLKIVDGVQQFNSARRVEGAPDLQQFGARYFGWQEDASSSLGSLTAMQPKEALFYVAGELVDGQVSGRTAQ